LSALLVSCHFCDVLFHWDIETQRDPDYSGGGIYSHTKPTYISNSQITDNYSNGALSLPSEMRRSFLMTSNVCVLGESASPSSIRTFITIDHWCILALFSFPFWHAPVFSRSWWWRLLCQLPVRFQHHRESKHCQWYVSWMLCLCSLYICVIAHYVPTHTCVLLQLSTTGLIIVVAIFQVAVEGYLLLRHSRP